MTNQLTELTFTNIPIPGPELWISNHTLYLTVSGSQDRSTLLIARIDESNSMPRSLNWADWFGITMCILSAIGWVFILVGANKMRKARLRQ